MVETEIEFISTPDIERQHKPLYSGKYCPFRDGECYRYSCKFWVGDDCIIYKTLNQKYKRSL